MEGVQNIESILRSMMEQQEKLMAKVEGIQEKVVGMEEKQDELALMVHKIDRVNTQQELVRFKVDSMQNQINRRLDKVQQDLKAKLAAEGMNNMKMQVNILLLLTVVQAAYSTIKLSKENVAPGLGSEPGKKGAAKSNRSVSRGKWERGLNTIPRPRKKPQLVFPLFILAITSIMAITLSILSSPSWIILVESPAFRTASSAGHRVLAAVHRMMQKPPKLTQTRNSLFSQLWAQDRAK